MELQRTGFVKYAQSRLPVTPLCNMLALESFFFFFFFINLNLSKCDQLLTTHCSPSTGNRDSFYRHSETVLAHLSPVAYHSADA